MAAYSRFATEESSLPVVEATTAASDFQSSLEGETLTQESSLSYMNTAETGGSGEEETAGTIRTRSDNLEKEGIMGPTPRRKKPFIISAVAAALLLLLAVGGLKAVQTLAKDEELALMNDELDGLFTDLNKRVDEFVERWNAASEDTKKAFAAHYLPSVEGMEADPAEGLELYMRHVEGLKKVRVPLYDEENKRIGYMRHVRTLTAVFMAATERLKGLEGLNQIYRENHVEANMLFKPDPSPLPSKDQLLNQTEDLLSFEDFIKMVPGVSMPRNAAQADQMIPRVLAEKVANMLRIQYKMSDEDYAIQEIFQNYFIGSYDLNLMTLSKDQTARMTPFGIGYDRMLFNSPAMASFLLYRYQHPGRLVLDERLMTECAKNYTVDGMLTLLETLRELDQALKLVRERRFAMENARLGPPPSKGHLLSLALFLV
ncbi:hypothetical protein Emag_001612 [Eimeria magna]